MPLPRPYFMRRTPGPDTFGTARRVVQHLLSDASAPQTTRALFAASTALDALPGTPDTPAVPLRTPAEPKTKSGAQSGTHVVRSMSYLKAVLKDLKTRNQIQQVQIPGAPASVSASHKPTFGWRTAPRPKLPSPFAKQQATPKAPWLPSALAALKGDGNLTHLNRRKRRAAVREIRVGALRLHSMADLERREREEVAKEAVREARRARRAAARDAAMDAAAAAGERRPDVASVVSA